MNKVFSIPHVRHVQMMADLYVAKKMDAFAFYSWIKSFSQLIDRDVIELINDLGIFDQDLADRMSQLVYDIEEQLQEGVSDVD